MDGAERDAVIVEARRRALHLELRDSYPMTPEVQAWLAGSPIDESADVAAWHATIGPAIRRGIDVRRLRVVSEPWSPYVCYEYAITDEWNTRVGERVRWLPRQNASDLMFPGNDFWLVDDVLVFNHFAGDGEFIGVVKCEDSRIVESCAASFEQAWVRGIEHERYGP
jgi:hypothetical protein